MTPTKLHRKKALVAFALLALLFAVGLLCFRGVELYRDVFQSSLVQKRVLPTLRAVCSAVERALQMRGDPAERAARLYRDLPIPECLQHPAAADENSHRLFLLCLDGASWEDVDAFGPLPNFERLRREGVWTRHDSTLVPISSCAWNAIDTGYLPEQTGVLGFQRPASGWPPRWETISARDFAAKTLAQRLDEKGEITFTVNLLNSYPEQIKRGVLIGGWWTDPKGVFTTPPELSEALRRRGYTPLLDWQPRLRLLGLLWALWIGVAVILLRLGWRKRRIEGLVAIAVSVFLSLLFSMAYWKSNRELRSPAYRLETLLENQFYPSVQMVLRMFEQPGWRFGAVHLHEIDTLNHHRYREEEARRGCYRETDRFLGTLLDRADERTLVAVVSDHGGTYYPKIFDLPAWLYAEGYLTDDPAASRAIALHEASANVGAIRLKEPSLAEEIKERLESLTDPLTGKVVVARVVLRSELHPGQAREQMPDLVVETDPEYMVQAYEKGYWQKKFRRFQSPPSDDPLYAAQTPYGPPIKIHRDWYVGGHHAQEGLFALWGRAVQCPGEVEKVPIEDIAPTLMMALDVPLPEDLPGHPHPEWFIEEFAATHPLTTIQDPVRPAPAPISAELALETLQTLEALDYLK